MLLHSRETHVFQFHLVRLKASSGRSPEGILSISIPFSTIKSMPDNIKSMEFNEFQFHLVRLKGRVHWLKLKTQRYFNSI